MATAYLTNTTARTIHIAGTSEKNSKVATNIIVAPLAVVDVPDSLLKQSGVAQLLGVGYLKALSEAEAKKQRDEHDGVLTSDDD
ncbi:TPA: hypothetical protein R4193_002837 [Serratia marcescens]|uniref:hypothetical protein n=1 Tax=Serratia marcescens TaxID=615 RepID=UPI001C427366|nr:hypothetical protein [Serratia marcescens]EGT0502879.1 hypothetical protein [Serratia marcescens]MDP8630522.1 hypothetical protein [Serratia marcescens]MDP8749354.1 hypothetical protein [Serratia marcescens]HBH7056214.1 hypothetical protein [Serratia marcescens]HED1520920.1 hypothetical protein [Serratia marcescens]